MKNEMVLAAVFGAGILLGLSPVLIDRAGAEGQEPPPEQRQPRDFEVCWRKTESGDYVWQQYPIGGVCPWAVPDSHDPDQESLPAEVQE